MEPVLWISTLGVGVTGLVVGLVTPKKYTKLVAAGAACEFVAWAVMAISIRQGLDNDPDPR